MTNALTEFVAQERIRLELGPRRLALAVDEGDLGQLALAMRAASSSWGGRRFPILPVDAEGQVSLGSKELLDILETSRVVDFTGRLATQGLVHSGRRRVPVVRARPLDDGSFWTPSAIVSHSLDALGGKRLLEAPSDDPFEVAAVGRLACREEVAEWEEFGAEVVEVSEETHVSSQLARQGVIDATLHGASTHMAAAAFGATIALVYVVGGEATFDDLHWFWNARALRPGDEGVDLLARAHHLLDHGAELAQHVRDTARSVPSLALVSLSLPTDDLRSLLEPLGIHEETGSKWTDHPFGGMKTEPTAIVNLEMRQGWTNERHSGEVSEVLTTWYRPKTTVALPGPISFAPRFTFAGPAEMRLRSPMFTAPRRAATAKLFHHNASWSMDALLLEVRLQQRYELSLNLPTPDQILRASVDLPFSASDKARQLRAILARETTEQLMLYRDRVVLAAIEALMPTDSRQLRRVLADVDEPDREYIRAAAASLRERTRTLDDVATSLGTLGEGAPVERVATALGQLVERGHVHRGLRADCTLCDMQELRQLTEAPGAATCSACGAAATYALGGRGEPNLFYRLSPVMRIICANGGLPVLAAAAVLAGEGAHLQAGADATNEGEDFEVDLLGWSGDKLFTGEAKRSAAGFIDVEKDARCSAGFGADMHIAATLDIIDTDLRTQMEAACSAVGLTLRVLDKEELLVPL